MKSADGKKQVCNSQQNLSGLHLGIALLAAPIIIGSCAIVCASWLISFTAPGTDVRNERGRTAHWRAAARISSVEFIAPNLASAEPVPYMPFEAFLAFEASLNPEPEPHYPTITGSISLASVIETSPVPEQNREVVFPKSVVPHEKPRSRLNLAAMPPINGSRIFPKEEPTPPRTAVYDIEARKVYLPNGQTLEAHSGLGQWMDDPRNVHRKNRGSTPPNVYRLALRESLFHGVQAIRLTPIDEDKMFGRDGILAHSYMLGPSGQSNGCVSFKEYSKFLRAFSRGEIDRIVVVPRLENNPVRTARATLNVKSQ